MSCKSYSKYIDSYITKSKSFALRTKLLPHWSYHYFLLLFFCLGFFFGWVYYFFWLMQCLKQPSTIAVYSIRVYLLFRFSHQAVIDKLTVHFSFCCIWIACISRVLYSAVLSLRRAQSVVLTVTSYFDLFCARIYMYILAFPKLVQTLC